MMISIGIENFLMIQNAFIKFDSELTVISGESGSGKSTIIDALCWCIGIENKRTKKLINASVTLYFLNDKCISRKSNASGKSTFFINNKRVFKRDVLSMIDHDITICRQDNRLLFSLESDFRQAIDEMIKEKSSLLYLKKSFERFKLIQNKLNSLNDIVNEDIEYIKQAIHEIDELNLQGSDEESLISARREQIERMKSYESLQKAREIFMNENIAIISQLTMISKYLNSSSPIIIDLQQRVDNVIYELQDVSDTIDGIVHQTHLNEESIHQIETQLSKIRLIAKKYRVNSIDLIELNKQYKNKLHIALNLESEKLQLTEDLKIAKAEFEEVTSIVNDIRMNICAKVAYDINNHLRDMKMDDITMQFIFKEKDWTENGNVFIQIYISNHRILSGGEMSRLLLAIKIATSKVNIPIIFDEIDIGVGGATAHIIGEKLKSLAISCQTIVVTHQAQVAAHSTHHILVSKTHHGAKIEVLSNESQVKEIARMISGYKTTNESILAAQKLIDEVKNH